MESGWAAAVASPSRSSLLFQRAQLRSVGIVLNLPAKVNTVNPAVAGGQWLVVSGEWLRRGGVKNALVL